MSFASWGRAMKMTTMRVVLAMLALGVSANAGCSVIVDGAIQDRDAGGGMDATVVSCTGVADGTACGTDRVCVNEVCALSACGDGVVDPGRDEECDDGNSTPSDGCEPTSCTFSCDADADCDDAEECNGEARCEEHRCVAGTDLENGTDCMLVDVPDVDAGMPDAGVEDAGVDVDGGVDDPTRGQCRAGVCVTRGCGNGVLGSGEECDDGNAEDGDGCDVDCTYTCETDDECQNETVCDGLEVCDVATHTCSAGTAPDCADTENFTNGRGEWGPDCTVDTCDAVMGCAHALRDADSDGYPPGSYMVEGTTYTCLGTAANDCNDIDDDVYPGAEEICDGRDNNCAGGTDETAPTWFADCDGDTFAPLSGGATHTGCTPPASTGCPNPSIARWTTTRPISGNRTTYDCNDANPNVRPTQTAYGTAIPAPGSGYDWNCDGTVTQEATNCSGICVACISYRGGCIGSDPGWSDGSASCGATESYRYCRVNPSGGCVVTEPRTQRCR
ncbi:MopE-related protein [Sandaracinus amylolyticus]|nr:MopE-related protein [Sandaracinus amylolyticus]